MKNIWTVADLDPRKLFEVIPNRDPETAARFSLPIPNWLDETGNLRFDHPDMVDVTKAGKKQKRFGFHNFEDSSDQAVKINGEGVIIFTQPTPGQVAKLREIIASYGNPSSLTPENVKDILRQSYQLGLGDRFNGSREDDILAKMDIVEAAGEDPAFGSFVYKPVISSCIYIPVPGEFHGPAETPQIFASGGFVEFKGQPKVKVRQFLESYDPEVPSSLKAKGISKAVFLKSRRMPDDLPIDTSVIPSQETQFKTYYKPKALTGFWEWLPEVRDVERQWIRTIEEVFERYGFANIETPAVEEVAVLTAKGEGADKKMYNLQPSQASEEGPQDAKLGLHYDLTVPMARYVAQHFYDVAFPFKRYQIQKVWRGDRPRKGRAREFVQCDIDVVDRGSVSLEFDAEFPIIVHSLAKELDIGNIVIGINNRKIFQGFFQGLGLDDDQIVEVIRAVDKMNSDKDEGVEGARSYLTEEIGLSSEIVEKSIALASIKGTDANITDRVLALGVDTPLLRDGLRELDFVMDRLRDLPKGTVVADLSIARGLDYYTGTVYEGKFADYPDYPAILAGGRYDNLVGNFMKQSLPGVGISFGLTRVFSKLLDENRLPAGRKTPTQALVAVPGVGDRDVARSIVDGLRARGISAEIYHEPGRLAKQLDYANKKGIPFVIFPDVAAPHEPQVRNMRTSTQARVPSIQMWEPGG